jgi:hypothetical protein
MAHDHCPQCQTGNRAYDEPNQCSEQIFRHHFNALIVEDLSLQRSPQFRYLNQTHAFAAPAHTTLVGRTFSHKRGVVVKKGIKNLRTIMNSIIGSLPGSGHANDDFCAAILSPTFVEISQHAANVVERIFEGINRIQNGRVAGELFHLMKSLEPLAQG